MSGYVIIRTTFHFINVDTYNFNEPNFFSLRV